MKKETKSALGPQSGLHTCRQALPRIKSNLIQIFINQPTHRQSRRSRFVITTVTFFIRQPTTPPLPQNPLCLRTWNISLGLLSSIRFHDIRVNVIYFHHKDKSSPAPIITKQRYTQVPYTELHTSGIISVGSTDRNEFGPLSMASAALIFTKLRKTICH